MTDQRLSDRLREIRDDMLRSALPPDGDPPRMRDMGRRISFVLPALQALEARVADLEAQRERLVTAVSEWTEAALKSMAEARQETTPMTESERLTALASYVVSFELPVDRTADEVRLALEALGAQSVRVYPPSSGNNLVDSVGSAPWITDPFRLVSLKEIVTLMNGSDEWPADRIIFGPLANTLYGLGSIEHGHLGAQDMLHVSFMLGQAAESLEGWGFAATCGAFRDLAQLIEDDVVAGRTPLHGREAIPTYVTMARQSLMHELEARVFLPVDQASARFYQDPRRDWEQVIERFPDAVSDIEEAGKCYALGRYAAAVFHSMQVMEHGLLALGAFMQVADPKSGFTAVSNELQRIQGKNYPDLSEFERQHLAFFQQMGASVQAAKDAWRNKISHAQGAPRLLTADFSQAVAQEIYIATRGFMRRLATEMPT